MVNVGKYTSHMDPMSRKHGFFRAHGISGICFHLFGKVWAWSAWPRHSERVGNVFSWLPKGGVKLVDVHVVSLWNVGHLNLYFVSLNDIIDPVTEIQNTQMVVADRIPESYNGNFNSGWIMAGWWFQTFFIFTPTWGNDPIWLIFFKWVGSTTN